MQRLYMEIKKQCSNINTKAAESASFSGWHRFHARKRLLLTATMDAWKRLEPLHGSMHERRHRSNESNSAVKTATCRKAQSMEHSGCHRYIGRQQLPPLYNGNMKVDSNSISGCMQPYSGWTDFVFPFTIQKSLLALRLWFCMSKPKSPVYSSELHGKKEHPAALSLQRWRSEAGFFSAGARLFPADGFFIAAALSFGAAAGFCRFAPFFKLVSFFGASFFGTWKYKSWKAVIIYQLDMHGTQRCRPLQWKTAVATAPWNQILHAWKTAIATATLEHSGCDRYNGTRPQCSKKHLPI